MPSWTRLLSTPRGTPREDEPEWARASRTDVPEEAGDPPHGMLPSWLEPPAGPSTPIETGEPIPLAWAFPVPAKPIPAQIAPHAAAPLEPCPETSFAHQSGPDAGDDPEDMDPECPSPDLPLEIHATPAPFGRRLLAAIIDAALISVFVALFLVVARAIVGPPVSEEAGLIGWRHTAELAGVLWLLLSHLYSTLLHWLFGRTVGKALCGLRVLVRTGRNPGIVRSAMRSVLVGASTTSLCLGNLVALFSARRQALHDLALGTFVVTLDEP